MYPGKTRVPPPVALSQGPHGLAMREEFLIDEISEALGQPIRKAAPGVVPAFSRFFNLDLIGLEERLEGTGDEPGGGGLYAADEHGNITALLCDSLDADRVPAIGPLRHLRLLVLLDTKLDAGAARALVSLPGLRHLLTNLDADGSEALRCIGEIRSLTSLAIECEGSADVSPLCGLPDLTTLFLHGSGFTNVGRLASHPALKNLACRLEGEGSHLAPFDRLETLFLQGKGPGDFSFLRELRSLRRLYAMDLDTALPPSVVGDLTGLRALATEYPHDSLEPLSKLRHLEELAVRKSKLTDLSSLAQLARLKRLDLAEGKLHDISALQGHESIEYLNLSENPISMFPERLKMPALEHLVFDGLPRGTRLTDAGFLSTCQQLAFLDLSWHELSDIGFLAPLGNLRYVNLSHNQIEDVSPLAGLPNVTAIDVSSNKIRKLAPLGEISALSALLANHNPVEDASALSRLPRLERLELRSTQIDSLEFTKRLRSLHTLDASSNEIRSMEPLLELPNLIHVDLRKNALSELPAEILERRTLAFLALEGNELEGIEPELYSGDGKKTLATLRDYYRGLARGRARHDQVKLLLVGNGRVGKTSVVTRLVDDTFDPDQPSTHGVQLRRWELEGVAQDKLEGRPLKVDIWDFGGQDVYHATHRLFMKTRALFLLVWDRETESAQYSIDELGQRYENFRLPYWIDYIKALSASPVIIVQNKVDEQSDKDPAYGLEMREAYPPPGGVVDYRYVSARRDEHNGMTGLREGIALALENLGSIGYELPEQWVKVRDRLLAMDHRYLDYDRYAGLCRSEGMQPEEDESLAGFLHQAGVVFYQPEDFGARLILDQKWAIEAVYALLDRRSPAFADLKVHARYGLTMDVLRRKVWQSFSVDEHELLLEFMKSCEICFELSKGVYCVPQLLPDDMPSRVRVRWGAQTQHCMQIRYPFLHRAIIERFLVRTGRLGADVEPEIWRNGIVILDERSGTEALVEAIPAESRILAHAKGEAPVEMLQMIGREFDELHGRFPATVAFSADFGKSFVEREVLREHVEAGSTRVPSIDGKMKELAPLRGLVEPRERRLPEGDLKTARRPEPAGEEIFLSYAWGDPSEQGESREAIVDRLYDTLVEKHYDVVRDKKDAGYRAIISDFMRRIGRGRLVIVVISDRYLKSPYCMFELLEIYEHGHFHERVFPVVLGDAKLYDLVDRLRYVAHWKTSKEEIERLIGEIGIDAFSSDGAYKEYDLYYRRVYNNIDKLTTLLKDWNALTPKLLEENSFGRLLGEVEKDLKRAGGAAADDGRA